MRVQGNNVILAIAASAPGLSDGGEIKLLESLVTNGQRGIESIEFADASVWTMATLRAMALSAQTTSGNDIVTAYSTNDILAGAAGDDVLIGGGGNDNYVYTRGDGGRCG